MPYPTIGEYKDAVRLAEHSFGNLTYLRPEYDATGDLHFSSGNFAVVFKMRDTRTDRPVAVKCFVREQLLRNQRYAQISQCLDSLPHTPYLLRYTYHPAEIWVETALSEQREFEVVTLDWVEGQTLSNYLQKCCKAGDTVALQKVAEAFDRLAIWLLEQPFAHGDLKPDNILVTPRGGLVLVDYDGMFTPDMAGQEATELGSPAFRHPYRSSAYFGKYIDHVPILVLSLSLHVLAEHPDWLEIYYQGDNLILTANDLSNPDSSIFRTIRTQCSAWTTQNRLLGLVNALILPISASIPITYLRSIPDYTDIQLIPYVKYFKDGRKRWGFCDEHKNMVVDFQYDAVKLLETGMIGVKINNKWGFLDKTGSEVFPCIYDEIHEFGEEGLAGEAEIKLQIAETNLKSEQLELKTREFRVSKRELMAEMARVLAEFADEEPASQQDPLLLLTEGGKCGLIDTTGKEAVPCIYDGVPIFFQKEELAKVKRDEKWGFIDKTGKEVVPCIYDKVSRFEDGLAKVELDGKWGLIDTTGKEVVPCIYDWVPNFVFEERFTQVKRDGKWGFIDTTGKEVVPCIYDEVNVLGLGLGIIKRDGKWGLIEDTTGKEVVPCIYDEVHVEEGFAKVKRDGKWGLIDTTGKEVVPCIYDWVPSFFPKKG